MDRRCLLGTAEVVEIARGAVQHAMRGHRGTAGQHEPLGLGQAGHERRDALL